MVLNQDADQFTENTLYGEAKSYALSARLKRMLHKAWRHLPGAATS